MTHEQFLALVTDECNEVLLHASYSVSRRDYETTRFALRVLLAGVRSRFADNKRTPSAAPSSAGED